MTLEVTEFIKFSNKAEGEIFFSRKGVFELKERNCLEREDSLL